MNIAQEQLEDAIEMRDRAARVVAAKQEALTRAVTELGRADRHVAATRQRVQIEAWAAENLGYVEGVAS